MMSTIKKSKTEQRKFSIFNFQFLIVLFCSAMFSIAITGCKEKENDKEEEKEKEEEVITGKLIINNLPDRPGQAYNVEIYQSGTVITIANWGRPEISNLGVAIGSVVSNNNSNDFELSEWTNKGQQNRWYETGNFPVVLIKVDEEKLSIFKVSETEIEFTNGAATIDFNKMKL